MELAHSLRLRQQAKLVMTPQLQQVIRLLQLPTMELIDHVRQEIESNPVLEEAAEEVPSPESAERAAEKEERDMDGWLELAAQEEPRETRDREREEAIEQARENRMVTVQTLESHLMGQVHLTEAPEDEVRLAEFLIGNLDGNGYLLTPLAELVNAAGAGVDRLEKALKLVQSLDPPGVGARDLRECLLLQLNEMEEDTFLAQEIVRKHLERLGLGDGREAETLAADALTAELGAPAGKVAAAVRQIRLCDPKPGSRFAEVPPAVYPDARVDKVGEDYIIVLNDGGLPPLRISRAYQELMARRSQLTEEERGYLKDRFRSALMLMRGIEQRRVTMYRVLEQIVKTQRGFLEQGAGSLRPLTLRQVADAIGVHESTVSRVVASKYVQTPRGIHPLKAFFSNRLPADSSAGVSGTAVKLRLRQLIEAEDAGAPLSDDALAAALKREGIMIARRTVTKYREAMDIPTVLKRKGKRREQDHTRRHDG
jgi:RNA polymerase sigma-54 factor